LTAELRLKVWRFVAVSFAEASAFNAHIAEPYYFEPFYGLLLQRDDWVLINRAMLLFEVVDEPCGSRYDTRGSSTAPTCSCSPACTCRTSTSIGRSS
jgi:hypothetical protein